MLALTKAGAMGLGVPLLLLLLLAMMILPLPPLALDALFSFNISLSLVIVLAVVYVSRPLEFSVFPTVLLVVTLLRLALNIASTRVVLLEGHTGTGAAGKVIEAFGDFVVGGNYAVGLVVFTILVIINFVVVTKGAGRISEVTARFTLDAMPGKQMAIDADLNAGIITQEEAKTRRQDIREEADFYGSMDGASKFVRGDAIAGILILFINIIGGISIGMAQHDLSLADAMHNYTLLTIGDGLVAQIPSLLLSSAVAVIVTRVSSQQNLGDQVIGQLFGHPHVLLITAGILTMLGLIPGMPNVAFLTLAAACGGGAYLARKRDAAPVAAEVPEEAVSTEPAELGWQDIPLVDAIGLEVGYRLIPLVDRNSGNELLNRIKGVRKKTSQQIGFLIQPVHVRDNLELAPNAYRVVIMGVPVAEAQVHVDRDLAINPGQVFGEISGIETQDPAFGLDAVWIEPANREHAQTLGYTVVDTSTVIATHLSQLVQHHAADLFGHQEAQHLLDRVAETAPKLVEDLVPKSMPMSILVKVLQSLLNEKIPLRNMHKIVESLAAAASQSQDPDTLAGFVRIALGRSIVQQISGLKKELPVLTLNPELAQLLQNSFQAKSPDGSANNAPGFEPDLVERVHSALKEGAKRQEAAGETPVLLVEPGLRSWFARLARHSLPNLNVLAFNEVPDDKPIRMVATVG
ncbi:MAG: flagellar biosynthesis protein FlhA [Gammaproteobacteria bacterium]|nr:flagellar biosynthesis protein FlhA [Gammaproteobacteria bacterium]